MEIVVNTRWQPLAVLVLASALCCQDEFPDAAALLDQMEERFHAGATVKVRSLVAKGKSTLVLNLGPTKDKPQSGTIEQFYDGNKVCVVTKLGKAGTFSSGTDGETVWEIDPASGPLIYHGDDRARILRSWRMQMGDSWREHYREAKNFGGETMAERLCWRIQLVPKEGEPETWYLDQETGDVAAVHLEIPVGNSREMGRFQFGDYTMIDGIRYPTRVSVSFSVVTLRLEFDSFEHNLDLPAERFALPEAIVKLKEAKPIVNDDNAIQIVTTLERPTLTIRVQTSPQRIGNELAEVFPEVVGYLTEQGHALVTPPFTRYHAFGAEMDLEAGVVVGEKIDGKGRIAASSLPAGRAVTGWHVGPYQGLMQSYRRIEKWLEAEGLEKAGAPWEVYWTDPGQEPDPAKYRTQIFWPVK